MPRKKEPPPSALPPRRSARGLSRSASSDADDSVELGVPSVGREETPEGLATSPPPPLLHPSTGFCETNKEISDIPSVSMYLNASEQDLGSFMNESSGGRIAIAESTPPVTLLFSPEFKAMIGREYPMRTVFSTRPALSGEATRGHGLWDWLAQCRSESVGESSSLPGVHVPLPNSDIAIDEGVQGSTELGNEVHVSTEMGDLVHGGGDLPRPSSPRDEVARDVGVSVMVDSPTIREGPEDTYFMEHVNKEKPFESKFFRPPDPGDSEPVEEAMKDDGAENPCAEKEGTDPRLSLRLTRLIEEQGTNRYRLRSGDETGKGPIRHHEAKTKLMKPDRGRRNKQSDSFDKENRPLNMTLRPEENNLSGHMVDEANSAGQLIAEANMQRNLHGDISGSADTSISPDSENMGMDEIQPGGPSVTGMQTTDKVMLNMEYAGESILNNMSTQSSSDEVLIEGEEQEVSSAQSMKHRSFLDTTGNKVSNCNMLEITDLGGFFPGITHVYEQGNQKLAQIILPDIWEDIRRDEGCLEEWKVIVNRNKECLVNENYMGIDELRKRMQASWHRGTEELATNFYYNNNLAIMGLEKWIGNHTNLCRVEKRKTRDQQGQQQILFNMEHGDCDITGCPFGRNKKVTKNKKDAQGFQIMADNRDRTNIKDSFEEGRSRKHWRIWSSKNRKPEKNLPKSKHHFQ
ncbi:hypothetical protein L1987_10627 [Smallanthus sonchifolius]|uniref:Uncharacterized protein n=1 Tax=Smallanthus sonchifolius TaxID=185202 RepID=A0ACB9JSZ5_9ASTR|nr:hypothetical protein L1987_10627 [Smallanthus sonchifolius]